MRTTQQSLQKGDIIGVCLDLSIPQISFTVNGIVVKGFFRDFNVDGMFFPVISLSAKIRYALAWLDLDARVDALGSRGADPSLSLGVRARVPNNIQDLTLSKLDSTGLRLGCKDNYSIISKYYMHIT